MLQLALTIQPCLPAYNDVQGMFKSFPDPYIVDLHHRRERSARIGIPRRAVYGEGAYRYSRCGVVYPPPRYKIEKGSWDPFCPSCHESIEAIPTHEDTPASPASVYAITKYNQEQLCLTVGNSYKLNAVALRYYNVYGPGQSLANPYTGILSTFFVRLKAGLPLEVYEDGHEQRVSSILMMS
jgi:nucleoside-diphosphate-sugar epimerase